MCWPHGIEYQRTYHIFAARSTSLLKFVSTCLTLSVTCKMEQSFSLFPLNARKQVVLNNCKVIVAFIMACTQHDLLLDAILQQRGYN